MSCSERTREYQAEDRADAGDEQTFEQNLHEDAADGKADQSKHADRFAALVHEHDRERQQKDGGGDDRDDGDGKVKALEHAKRSCRSGRFARGKREHAGKSRVDILRKLVRVLRIDECDVH